MTPKEVTNAIKIGWPDTNEQQLEWINRRAAGISLAHPDQHGTILEAIVEHLAGKVRFRSLTLAHWMDATAVVLPTISTAVVLDHNDERREAEEREHAAEVERVRAAVAQCDRGDIRVALTEIREHFAGRGEGAATAEAVLRSTVGTMSVDDWTHAARCWVLTWLEYDGAACLEGATP